MAEGCVWAMSFLMRWQKRSRRNGQTDSEANRRRFSVGGFDCRLPYFRCDEMRYWAVGLVTIVDLHFAFCCRDSCLISFTGFEYTFRAFVRIGRIVRLINSCTHVIYSLKFLILQKRLCITSRFVRDGRVVAYTFTLCFCWMALHRQGTHAQASCHQLKNYRSTLTVNCVPLFVVACALS